MIFKKIFFFEPSAKSMIFKKKIFFGLKDFFREYYPGA